MADDLVQRLHVASTKMAALFGHMLDILGRDGVREIGLDPDSDGDVFKEAADALARKDEEIARLTKCLSIANSQAEEFERKFYLESDRAERAEARVREAPVVEAIRNSSTEAAIFARDLPAEWIGKRVALVLLATEEAK